MIPMHSLPHSYPLVLFLVAGLVGACAMEHPGEAQSTQHAINRYTGEIRTFDEDEMLPSGWALCEEPDDCPALLDCDALGEVACLLRPDCERGSPQPSGSQCEAEGDVECAQPVFARCQPATILCSPSDCGPRPDSLSVDECVDGSPAGYTGRCVWRESGHCVWEHHDCPVVCDPGECGELPQGVQSCLNGDHAEGFCVALGSTPCAWLFLCL